MDIASLVGFIMVMVGVWFGMIMKGADPVAMFTNFAALLIVIVGAFGATIMSFPMPVTTMSSDSWRNHSFWQLAATEG